MRTAAHPAYGDDRTLVGYPYQSYSVFIVLDRHSLNPVAGQVAQIETVQQTTLNATVGSVVTSGPAGIGRPDALPYDPPGYDPIYSTWNVQAGVGNEAAFNLNVTQGTLINPVIVIHNYTAADETGFAVPQTLLINGVPKSADVDYFASLDAANNRLWLTLNGAFSGSTHVQLAGTAPVPTYSIYLPFITRR